MRVIKEKIYSFLKKSIKNILFSFYLMNISPFFSYIKKYEKNILTVLQVLPLISTQNTDNFLLFQRRQWNSIKLLLTSNYMNNPSLIFFYKKKI